jgi:hypothetical protein
MRGDAIMQAVIINFSTSRDLDIFNCLNFVVNRFLIFELVYEGGPKLRVPLAKAVGP